LVNTTEQAKPSAEGKPSAKPAHEGKPTAPKNAPAAGKAQAKPAALSIEPRVCLTKPLEDMWQEIRRDSDARVADRDLDV